VWAETFSRDRADLGPAVAAQRVASDADLCASQRPLADALTDLRTAWTVEDTRRRELLRATSERDRLRQFVTAKADYDAAIIPLDIERQRAAQAAQRATSYADQLTDVVEATAGRYADRLQQQRDELRADVRETARTVLDGPGRFGLHHRRVENATAELTQWADNWRPVVPDLPTDPDRLARTAAWLRQPPSPRGHRGLWPAPPPNTSTRSTAPPCRRRSPPPSTPDEQRPPTTRQSRLTTGG
jgi:hypothetical protein